MKSEKKILSDMVQGWQAEGRWVDRGRWMRASNGTPEYVPTKREIAAKCRQLRDGRQPTRPSGLAEMGTCG